MPPNDPTREQFNADNPRERENSREFEAPAQQEVGPSKEQESVAREAPTPEEELSGKVQALGGIGKAAKDSQSQAPAVPKTHVRKEIESVLAEHINTMLAGMDEQQKTQFKMQANETASSIEGLVNTAKATAKKVIRLITDWLKLIPGVNMYYIEQEAKIKADRILELQNSRPTGPAERDEQQMIIKEE